MVTGIFRYNPFFALNQRWNRGKNCLFLCHFTQFWCILNK